MNNEKKAISQKQHSVFVENRKKAVFTGVTDTDKFNENVVLLYTCMGEVTVRGRNLKVSTLSVDTGDMVVEGDINAVIYGDSQVTSPLGFLGRLMK